MCASRSIWAVVLVVGLLRSALGWQLAAKAEVGGLVTQEYSARWLIDGPPVVGSNVDLRLNHPASVSPAPEDDRQEVAKHQQRSAELLQRIRQTIQPGSWDDQHTVRVEDERLIVRHRPEIQAEIAQLVRNSERQATIEVRFLNFGEIGVMQMALPLRELLRAPRGQRPFRRPMSDDQAKNLLRALQATEGSSIVTAPRLTLFNGQRAYVLVAEAHTDYVQDYKLVDDGTGNHAFAPQTQTVTSGILVDSQSKIAPGGAQTQTQLRAQWAELLEVKTQPFGQSPPGQQLMIDRPIQRVRQIDQTFTLPTGQWVLIGGFDEIRTDAEGKEATESVKDLIAMIRVTVLAHEQTTTQSAVPVVEGRPATRAPATQPAKDAAP